MSHEREKTFYCLVGLCCSGGWTPWWPGRVCACCSIQLEARFSASCISSRSPGSRQLCRQGERKDEGRGRHHGLSGWPAWPGKRLYRGCQIRIDRGDQGFFGPSRSILQEPAGGQSALHL